MSWTSEQIADLRHRLDAGQTYAEIAKAYGRTHRAMSAAIHRLRKTWGEALPTAKPRASKRVAPPAPAPSAGVLLLDRTGCCWPVEGEGDRTRFCDAPCGPNATYCAGHKAIGTRPTSFVESRILYANVPSRRRVPGPLHANRRSPNV